MGKLTPFGVALRKLRIDKNMRLFDLAEKISKSAAFLSAVETGRKPIPDGFIVTLSRAMDLTAAQIRELRSAKDQTLKEVKVDHLPAERRELIAAFARRLDELPVGFLDEVRKRVLKSCDGDVPFKRKRRGMVVPPMSAASIAALAENVRRIFCTDDRIAIPIIDILEFGLVKFDEDFVFEVRSVNEMKGDEGMVVAGQPLPAEPNEFRDEVEAAAERLGANRAAVFKWRQRGIPTEWQIKLFEHDQRRFKFSELARLRPDSPPEDNSGAAA